MLNKVALFLMNQKGLSVLEYLVANNYAGDIAYVVIGRDAKVVSDFSQEIEGLASKNKISVYERNAEPQHDGYKIAIGWRWLNKDTNKLIVFHDSLLPKYRGFAPLVNALVKGEKEIGATAIFASSEYDRGPIISQKKIAIDYPITIRTATELMSTQYDLLVEHIFSSLQAGKALESVPQIESDATYSIWLDEDDYQIDWEQDAQTIRRFIDAKGFPYRGAQARLNGDAVVVLAAEEQDDVVLEHRHAGKILFLKEGSPVVICGKGLLKITQLIAAEDGADLLPLKRFRVRFE